MNSSSDDDLPASSKRQHLFSLALSVGICFVGSLSYLGILVILSPGLYIARWFLPAQFATPKVRIAIIASISILVYWPVFFFFLQSIRECKQLVRFATPLRLLGVLGIGAGASLIAHKLITLSPTVFGLLSVPSDYASFFVYTLFGVDRSVRPRGTPKTGHTWTPEKRPTERNQNKTIYTVREVVWANLFW
jgi:hypothetical protein